MLLTKKAIFLDKDGTLIPDIPYNVNPDLVTLSNHTIKGLKMLSDLGFQLIVISNQSGVAKGYFSLNELLHVESKLQQLLSPHTVEIKAFYYCPHNPENNCDCRKPQPGMLLKAANDLEINLSESWMIGDILNDVEAGNKAGCKSILIDNGNETEWLMNPNRHPSFLAKNINHAAEIINRSISMPQPDILFEHE
jgi:histidinol-phosphate phosphatase family protein